MMKPHERIIQERGHQPTGGGDDGGNEEPVYAAMQDSGGHPQMGFTLIQQDGNVHAFLYHNLDNLDRIIARDGEYLNFTHRGKAVTLRGSGLLALLNAMISHTLISLHEHDGAMAYYDGEPVIERAKVTNLNTLCD